MIDSLKFFDSNLCEIGRSSLAATSRDKVLSSGINNCLLLDIGFRLTEPVELVALDSFTLARSELNISILILLQFDQKSND